MVNNKPTRVLEYDANFSHLDTHRNTGSPERVFLVGPMIVMLKLYPLPGEGRMVWKDRRFHTLRTGGTVEPLAQTAAFGEVGDLALVRDQLWLADSYDPWIQVYDLSGKHVRTLGQHLKDAPFCMHSDKIGSIPPYNDDLFDKRSAGMQFTSHVLNLENQVVLVGPYFYPDVTWGADDTQKKSIRHWDVYAPDGTLLIPQMPCPIRDSGNRFVQNGNNDEFYLIDDISDDLESKNLSARIHIYRLAPRWREALEQMKAKAAS